MRNYQERLQLTKVADSFGFLQISVNRRARADSVGTVLNSFELNSSSGRELAGRWEVFLNVEQFQFRQYISFQQNWSIMEVIKQAWNT